MIQAREIRLGNYFQDKKGRLCEVLRLSKDPDEVRISSIDSAVTSMPVEPIPLTEEWLLKFGFRWSESLGLFMMWESITIFESAEGDGDEDSASYSIHFYHNGDHVIVESNNEHGEYTNLKFQHIKYVHQLQNLYFALTGTELS